MALFDRKIALASLPAGVDPRNYPRAADFNAILDHVDGAWINVKSHGAACDGSTDDSAAWAAALAALPAGGGMILVPGSCNLGTTGIVIPAGQSNVTICGASKGGTVLTYTGTGTAITVGTSAADTHSFVMNDVRVDSLGVGGGGVKLTRVFNFAFSRVWIQGRTSGSDSGIGLDIDGTGNWIGNATFDLVRVNGNWTTALKVDGPSINTANHFAFNTLSIARTTTKPGTGTIGFHWGENAGDGAMMIPDVEGYDVAYQIDGRFLFGPIRAENNTTAVRFGAASTSNMLSLQGFVNTTARVDVAGQALNSLIEPLGWQYNLNNGATDGTFALREATDNHLELSLRAGAAADKRVRWSFRDRNGAITHYIGKDSFNRFGVWDGTAGYARMLLGGLFAANDGFDLRGKGTGSIKLNVGDGTEQQGTGGTQFGDGHGNVVGSVDSAGTYENATAGGGVILKAPGGARYRVTVSDAGSLVVTAL